MVSGQAKIEGRVRHAVLQQQVGFYTAFVPPGYESQPDRFYSVCFLLHDHDSSEEEIAAVALQRLPRERTIYVAPRAPHLSDAGAGRYRVWPATFQEWNQPDYPRNDLRSLRIPHVFTDSLAACLANVRERYRTDNERIVVFGHGEGATYAHVFAYHHPELVRAYFAHGGGPYDIPPDGERLAQILKRNSILPYISHSLKDPTVPVSKSVDLLSKLERHEVEHRSLFVEAPTHDVVPQALDEAAAFLGEYLGNG